MNNQTRSVLFWSFVILFLLLSAGAWFYAQGWRLAIERQDETSFITIKPVKTGTLALSVISPPDTQAFLDGKRITKGRNIITRIARDWVIRGLTPGSYTAEVKRDGYETWQKVLEVEGGEVTALLAIFLAPEKIDVQEVGMLQRDTMLFPNANFSRMLKLSRGSVDEIVVLEPNLKTLASSTLPLVVSERIAPEVMWDASGERALIVGRNIEGAPVWLLWNVGVTPPRLENPLARPEVQQLLTSGQSRSVLDSASGRFPGEVRRASSQAPQWHPFNPNSLILLTSSGSIARWDLETNTVEKLVEGPALVYAQDGNALWWIGSDGRVWRFDLILRTNVRLAERAVPEFVKPKRYELSVASGRVVVSALDAEEHYLFADGFWQALGEPSSFGVSPDGKKLAAAFSGHVEVLFLDDMIDYGTMRQKGDTERIDLTERTVKTFWLGSAHLLIQTEGALWLAELDGRGGRNTAKLLALDADTRLFFDTRNNILYVQDKKGLARLSLKE